MAYEKSIWEYGNRVTPAGLNNLERGVLAATFPPHTVADAGKVLSVTASGQLAWISPASLNEFRLIVYPSTSYPDSVYIRLAGFAPDQENPTIPLYRYGPALDIPQIGDDASSLGYSSFARWKSGVSLSSSQIHVGDKFIVILPDPTDFTVAQVTAVIITASDFSPPASN